MSMQKGCPVPVALDSVLVGGLLSCFLFFLGKKLGYQLAAAIQL